jgi:HEAT repeat protein
MKRELRRLLAERRLDEIVALADGKRRALSTLVSLTFDREPEIGWRAVEAMGVVAASVAARNPEAVREHLRSLLWLLSEESGGICWHAPEAMAEIVARSPGAFTDFVPIIVHLIEETAEEDLAHFRPGMLWAIGRLGAIGAKAASEVLPTIVAALGHAQAQVRGMAAWTLGRLGQGNLIAEHGDLLEDEGAVDLYENGMLNRTTVAVLARHAVGVPATGR